MINSHPLTPSPQPLPSGTVTFLFTDIEGSTKLAQANPATWRQLQERHHAILRKTIEAHNGYVFQIIGDAFCAAFATAGDALRASIKAQTDLNAEDWGTSPIKVRMGLHTGQAELQANGDYVGYVSLSRVQRLMSAGHGGQVLLSLATQELVRDDLPKEITLRDMGEHRLKDLIRPEHVFQLVIPNLPSEFAPLKTLEAFPNNLPIQMTSFIGRENEIAEIKQELSAHHLVTLTGSGGTGKTRLSLQVAADLLGQYEDGVWFIELAPLTDPALVVQGVASTFGLKEEAGRSLETALKDYLREKSLLLILDNCEHLIAACAQFADTFLHACPKLKILASSREALGIAGESAYHVPSLSVPDPNHLPSIETLSQYDAVRLFIDRAVMVQPAFAITNQNAPALAQICYRLDGIPLAIELAASRVKALKVEDLEKRLDDRFRLLTGGSRTALPRQQTLRALIDWSYDLLSEPERLLLRRLSVFAGGWTLEALESVCADNDIVGASLALARDDILDLTTHLVDKSLIILDEQAKGTRYRILETIRQYAREKFLESGEGLDVRNRHLDYFLSLAERAEPEVQGAEQQAWLDRLEVDHDNFRAALEWSLGGEETRAEAGLRMAGSLWWFWFMRGYSNEGGEWLERILIASQTSADLVTRAKALCKVGWLKSFGGTRTEEGLALGRTLGLAGRESMALALWGMGAWAYYQAEYARAKSLEEESLNLFRELGHRWGICETLCWLESAMSAQGDYQQAAPLFEESLTLARHARDSNEIGWSLWQLGGLAMTQGNFEQATTFLEESLALYKEIKSPQSITWLLGALGNAALYKGDYQQAVSRYEEALALYWERGDERRIAEGLEQLANAAAVRKQPEQAARLLGAAEALRDSSGAALHPFQRADYERCLEMLRPQLDEARLAVLWAAGRAMTMKQAVAFALESTHE